MDSQNEQAEVAIKPFTKWKNEPAILTLQQDLTDALPNHDEHKIRTREWLDNLHVRGQAQPKTGENNSRIQPKLIRKQAEWRYSALSEPFLSTDDVFNVRPVSWNDREAAQQNELVLNNQWNTVIDKVAFFDEYVRTAVDEGTVIVRVGWDFQEEAYKTQEPTVVFRTNPALAPLHQHLEQMKQESPAEYDSDVPAELQVAHDMTMQQGVPIEPVITGYHEVTKKRTVRNCPTVEVCDYRNIIVDPTCLGDIEKAGFVIYSFETSLSKLKEDGKYKNLDKINIDNSSILGTPDHSPETLGSQNFNFNDKPRKKFVAYEYWGYWDIDGSGMVKPIVATWVGQTLIRMEENPFPDKLHPFVSAQYLPVRKSVYGEPDGALLEDNQKIIGAVTRGMIDIMGKSANGQTGIRKDMLDATNRRKFDRGQDYEFNVNVDPRQGVFMHTYPEIPSSAQVMLQIQNAEAESLTGVKAYSDGVSGASLGPTAAGVRGALDASSKRELGILRRLANGIVKIGRKMIAMNAVFLSEQEVVRVTDEEFITVNRDDLMGNFHLRLTISTAEEDAAKAQELAFMLQTVGPSEDPIVRRMILGDICRLRKMPDVAKKVENYQPQPDPMQQQMAELQLQLLQAQVAVEQAKVGQTQANAQLHAAKASTEEVKQGHIKSDTDLKNLHYVEQESGVNQERDLQKIGAQAAINVQSKLIDQQTAREQHKHELLKQYMLNRSK